MPKKIYISTVSFFLVSIASIILLINHQNSKFRPFTTTPQKQITTPIVLFYGDGCPHCALVEKYVAENTVETKVPFVKKEVYHDKQNANELKTTAAACGLPTDSIGVPFLWDGSKCIIGDQPIIDFFKQRINEQ